MTPTAYFNGEWIPADALRLPVDDLGFVLGATVVERMRTFQGQIFRLDEHLQRLRRSLEIVGWDSGKVVDEIGGALEEFLRRNAGLIVPEDDWTLTAFVTPGRTVDASLPTICVHGLPLPFADWARKYETGVELVIADVRQVPPNCWLPELKCRSRLHYFLADREARAKAPGSRALVLDQDGFVGEATTANIVAHFADRGLIHPPLNKVLHGVSQNMLFELSDELGIAHTEQDIMPADLAAADEIFLTSTSVCVLPVVQIDGQPVGHGSPGSIYRKLLTAWSERVGVDIAAQAARFSVRGA